MRQIGTTGNLRMAGVRETEIVRRTARMPAPEEAALYGRRP